jgi:hypothetical protein
MALKIQPPTTQPPLWINSIGDTRLAVAWSDPDFDAAEPSFYYVRVLEIPTPRWIV